MKMMMIPASILFLLMKKISLLVVLSSLKTTTFQPEQFNLTLKNKKFLEKKSEPR